MGSYYRYAVRVNSLSQIALTKLDILTGVHPIRICHGYRAEDQVYRDLPFGISDITTYEPVYEEMHGWDDDVSNIRTWDNLPLEARTYIIHIEDITGIPVRSVSVGPERSQIIKTI